MPTKRLPARPSLDHLKHQADDLRNQHKAGRPDALQRLREFHPRFARATDAEIAAATLTVADSQLAIAREYGFPSWPKLRVHLAEADPDLLDRPHHERIADKAFRRAVDLLDAGDVAALREHLALHPDLVRRRVVFEGGNYFRDPALLEFVAENPIRHGRLPANIVDVARVILDAGGAADQRSLDSALGLVCSGQVPRECGVQIPLIELLCDYGANPDEAMLPALGHGEFAAVEALLRRGATLDLPVAAATGRVAEARRVLAGASSEARHKALALAAQHGQAEIVRLLLAAGEDPNRYNPVGCHAHSTPLHQAALAGHLDVVRALVEGGARLDLRDIHHQSTPLGWAEYDGRDEVAEYLRAQAAAGR